MVILIVFPGKKFACRDFPCRDRSLFLDYQDKYLIKYTKTCMAFEELNEFYKYHVNFIGLEFIKII